MRYRFIVVLSIFYLNISGVHASGFALREMSASAQGNAFAGSTAAAEDASYMAYNPAAITRQKGDQVIGALTVIEPHLKFKSQSAKNLLGININGGQGGKDAAPDTVVPAFYLSHEFSPDFYGGISLTVPYGLTTKYDSGWIGRYHALKTDLRTFELSPVAGFRLTRSLSVGLGLRIAYTRGSLSNAIDFGTLDALPAAYGGFDGSFGGTPTQNDGTAKVEGEDLALGYSLGLIYTVSPETRVGVSYHSKIHNQLDGSANFNNGSLGTVISNTTGLFTNSGIRAEINLPEHASFGIYHEIDSDLAIMGDISWTRWSRVNELRVHFDNALQPDNVVAENWKNTWFFALGATRRISDNLSIKGGVAYDQSPTRGGTRTPRIPDEDRKWVSIGLHYDLARQAKLDVTYSHLFIDRSLTNLKATDPGNGLRGSLQGTFKLDADVLALQFRATF